MIVCAAANYRAGFVIASSLIVFFHGPTNLILARETACYTVAHSACRSKMPSMALLITNLHVDVLACFPGTLRLDGLRRSSSLLKLRIYGPNIACMSPRRLPTGRACYLGLHSHLVFGQFFPKGSKIPALANFGSESEWQPAEPVSPQLGCA